MKAPGPLARAAGKGPYSSRGLAARAKGARTVLVEGELDLDSADALYQHLRRALDHSAAGVVLDLRQVAFCDCSGLSALLRARRRALAQGKTLSIRSASPAMRRLLALTRTRALFTAATSFPGDASAVTRALERPA
ncbi:STAS domain-containing protein [Streptomyces sp. NBC_00083]|uniref:STAS domain-containing protein n=1 Tax=Streptomyces sp. NBC_00083 TaxID=2975647 RepID=UPI00224D6FB2|nr:STAS domain-containing protein [Streptomyces sp. NBC_00083]MCX5384561.1 STAS domain-containing protein [Streptomyces sp. NBC_00083]